jgi:YesN/AraC family two-component response regulator
MKARQIKLDVKSGPFLIVKEIKANHFSTPFHFHDCCELNYVKKSTGKRVVGDSLQNFCAGDLVLMSPTLPHTWYNDPAVFEDKSKIDAEAIVTYFSVDIIKSLANDNIVQSKFQQLLISAERGLNIFGKTATAVIAHLETLKNKKGLQQVVDFLLVIDLLINTKEYRTIANVRYSHSYNSKDTERMNKVYRYIMNNFTDEITLNEIAAIANITPPAFCTFFKKRTQKSFTRFLNEIRVGHACQLLEKEEISISSVCFESGYQNFANFNKFFKEITGKTPSQYRKEIKNPFLEG